MIVDDEPMIRQGLQSLIDWDQYDFEVVSAASNGVEALENYKQHKPDLILIDIRMPIMDGIRTIEELRKLGAQSRILILSGYGEFQYAQQAIRYKVDGYILKPIDEIELTTYIEKLSKELKQKQQEVKLTNQTVALLREEWLKSFVAHELTEDELLPEQWEKLFESTFQEGSMILLDTYSKEHSLNSRNIIRQQLASFVEGQQWGYVFSTDNYIGIMMTNVSFNPSKQERLEELIALACNERSSYVAIVSDVHLQLSAMYEQVTQVKSALKNRFFLNENSIYNFSNITLKKQSSDSKDSITEIQESNAQKLSYIIDVGNKVLLNELIDEVAEQLLTYYETEQQIKSSWAQLLTLAINRISAAHPQLLLEEDLKVITKLYLTHHYDKLLLQLKQQLASLIDRINESESSNTTVMKQMIDFIDRHYAEPLRLETMAELFSYNSGYLGKMFKNHTGESFNTYLDKVRIDHAIELLQEGKKVHQVAELVGYANVDYFHSKIKRYKGVSPSAFKPGSTSKK